MSMYAESKARDLRNRQVETVKDLWPDIAVPEIPDTLRFGDSELPFLFVELDAADLLRGLSAANVSMTAYVRNAILAGGVLPAWDEKPSAFWGAFNFTPEPDAPRGVEGYDGYATLLAAILLPDKVHEWLGIGRVVYLPDLCITREADRSTTLLRLKEHEQNLELSDILTSIGIGPWVSAAPSFRRCMPAQARS